MKAFHYIYTVNLKKIPLYYRRIGAIHLTFILLIFLCWGCKKETSLDYRDIYTGKYSFEVKTYQWDINQGIYNEVVENTEGEVFYKEGVSQKNIIQIHYKDSLTAQFKIDNLGFVFTFCNSKIGEFNTINGTLDLAWSSNSCPGGGMGGGAGTYLKGNRL